MERPTLDELCSRIQRDIDRHDGKLPQRDAIAWDGYLAALIEWGLISVADHAKLSEMLPTIKNNPAIQIMLGSPGMSD